MPVRGNGVCLGGVCLEEGVSAWGRQPGRGCTPTPVDRMTDTCENITFPQLLLRMVKTAASAAAPATTTTTTTTATTTAITKAIKRCPGMAHLHRRTQIRMPTQIRIPNQWLHCTMLKMFTLHRLGLRSLLPISGI